MNELPAAEWPAVTRAPGHSSVLAKKVRNENALAIRRQRRDRGPPRADGARNPDFLGFVSWTGFWFLDGGRPASKVESMLWFALAGLLVVDVTFWAWAGLRRFPLLLTTVAVIPPVVLGAVYVIGVLSRAF